MLSNDPKLPKRFQACADGDDCLFRNAGAPPPLQAIRISTYYITSERIQAHEITFVAGTSAVFGRCRNEMLIRTFLAHLVKDAALCSYNEIFLFAFHGILQQSGGRRYLIRQLATAPLHSG